MNPVIEVKNYTKKYKKMKAVDNVSFSVFPGEFHGFIGENGAGKTTTIKAIIGAYKKYQGSLNVSGINSKKESSRKKLGYIPEYAKFPTTYTVHDYLKSMAKLSNIPNGKIKERIDYVINLLEIEDLRKKYPSKFSSGQKKKVLLAQALLNDPEILVMDEPAANLDPKGRLEFFTILKKMQKAGKAIFISSHILAELGKYVDSVTIISKGTLVFSGKVEKLKSTFTSNNYIVDSPQSDKLEALLKSKRVVYKKVDNGFSVTTKDEKSVFSLIKSINDSKIILSKSNFENEDLEQIYKNVVIDKLDRKAT